MTNPIPVRSGSIRDAMDCQTAAHLMRDGKPIGTFIRGVCGIWADGGNAEAVETVYKIKGEARGRRPFGTTLSATAFVKLIDPDHIAAHLRDLFLDAEALAMRLGSLCFIRIPIRKEAAEGMPTSTLSQTDDGTFWLQNWLPDGCRTTQRFMEAIEQQDIRLPIATSMNVSGQPELVAQADGVAFCRSQHIPLFLGDRHAQPDVHGSFPIVQVDGNGVQLVREGQFPGYLFKYLLAPTAVGMAHVRAAAFPVVRTHSEAEAAVVPHRLRQEIIERLDGKAHAEQA